MFSCHQIQPATCFLSLPFISTTTCIDQFLGGGIPCGQLTEICGPPETGKTTFMFYSCSRRMQLALQTQQSNQHTLFIGKKFIIQTLKEVYFYINLKLFLLHFNPMVLISTEYLILWNC